MSTSCIIALTLSAAVIIALAAANIVRSREIRLISRQLQFIRDNTSNMEITASTPFREINELSQSVNEVLEKYKKIELHSERREREFKSTITNLSHDIRTPLTSLDGYFQLLSQASSDEEKSHYSEIIGERINSLKNILEELFTYTKLQDNQFSTLCLHFTTISAVKALNLKLISAKRNYLSTAMKKHSKEFSIILLKMPRSISAAAERIAAYRLTLRKTAAELCLNVQTAWNTVRIWRLTRCLNASINPIRLVLQIPLGWACR